MPHFCVVQIKERTAHESHTMQLLRMQVAMEFNCATPGSALKLLEELEPAEDQGAAIQHEYSYFREEVEAGADHGMDADTPERKVRRVGGGRCPSSPQAGRRLKMLRHREETGARFRLGRLRARWTAGQLNMRSALNPSRRLPPPRSTSHLSRGYGMDWG